MRWIRAVAIAFSAFSRIPAPRVEFDDDAMKLSIAFLPLVGIPVGGAVWGLERLCERLGLSAVMFAALAVALPVIITGGIHLDGYCDTSDALAAHADTRRSLEILKDTRVGAFAVIRICVYFVLSFAMLHELYMQGGAGLGLVFVLSRCFSSVSCLTMPNARTNGMLAAFTLNSDRVAAGLILGIFCAAALGLWLWFAGSGGLFGLAAALAVTAWYRVTAKKRFGGATGDTTGYYQQITELALLAGLVLGGIAL